MGEDNKTSQHLNDINQDFKEKEVAKKAEEMGIPYINLLEFRVNPDSLALIPEEGSLMAKIVVFFQIGKKLRVAVSDPNNIHAKRIISQFQAEHFLVNLNLASEESVQKIQKLYKSSFYQKEEKEKDINIDEKEEKIAEEALKEFGDSEEDLSQKTADNALSDIHTLAIKMNVSDIHFQAEKENVHIRFRIDGILQDISQIDFKTYDGLVKQIKFNSHLKLNITKTPQDGQYMFSVNKREIDVRVSTLPSSYGESIVMRILDSKKGVTALSQLGYKKYALEKIANILAKPEGLILVTGPTGSGKTSTLYSMLDVLNRPYRKIITLEDPVEYRIPGIVQCEAQQETEENTLSFEKGLQSILRQDPDIIMLGEIRESKVANTAIQAAMTGHLVLSTLHTNSAIESLFRLIHLGIPKYLLSPSLNAIIAQRLIRRVCSHCAEEVNLSEKDKKYIQITLDKLHKQGIKTEKISEKEKQGKGCSYCNKTGYLGRITVAEVLPFSQKQKNLLLNEEINEAKVLQLAINEGFISMKEDGILKVISGETNMKEVFRVLG